MENENNQNMNSDRSMRWNKFHSHSHFMLIRLILGLIILGVVFMIGMKIGEFKGEFGYDHGGYEGYGERGMMRGNPGMSYPFYQGGNQGTQTIPPQNTNTVPAPTTTK